MQIVSFICPIPPSVNDYLGKKVAYASGKYFVKVYETAKAKEFKKLMKKIIQREVVKKGWEKTGEFEYVVCSVNVYLPQKKRDSDNLFKCLLDSFTESEIIYDDSMVIPRVNKVFIDSENPRLEVSLYKSIKKGIFENENQLEEFKSKNCYNCKRMKRNCSILRKSLENRITTEVDLKELRCGSFK